MRAKRWLERTTRVNAMWVNPEWVAKLTFSWADGTQFSFDLGGQMLGGELNGQEFFAEIKKYSQVGSQPEMYSEYLAKCYRAYSEMPTRCDHFFWVTWHPFSQSKWPTLCTAAEVKASVLAHSSRCFGEPDAAAAAGLVNAQTCDEVAKRLWLIVLSDKQEELALQEELLEMVWAKQKADA
jgi:hypothetical protein